MDPFNAPSIDAPVNFSSDLSSTVGKVAPLATQWHGAQTGTNIQQVFNKPTTTAQPGVVSKFAHFIGGIGSEVGHIATGAASWLGKNVVSMAESPYHYAQGLSHAILDNADINMLTAQTKHNTDSLDALHLSYKQGRITAQQYKEGLNKLALDNNSLVGQQTALDNRINANQGQAYKATVDVASLLVTILTAGFGKAYSTAISAEGLTPQAAKTTADFLTSTNANAYLSNVEAGLSHLASNPEAFANLPESAQKALQAATAEVVAGNSGTMTAGQIARASAANLALKYPIYYNALSSTGQQLYNELNQQKYGDATRTLAFNALLLLSGGPIGQALKYGGKGAGGLVSGIFGRTSFIDELSKGIGDSSPDGLFKAITNIEDPALRKEVIQNMSHLEATNLAAVDGKDPVAAAWRVLNGMSSYEGVSMNQFTHEEALNNMVNFAKAQNLADQTAASLGMGPVTVGRVDAGSVNRISAAISQYANSSSKDEALNAWDALKAQNPNAAWANNDNFDRQIKALINKYDTPHELDTAIRNIKADGQIAGFPASVNRQLAKMGYLPISPKNLEAPFKVGTGKLTTKFADQAAVMTRSGMQNDFFVKAVQPLPVLDSIGTLLTGMGLSPQASGARVYQIFNNNLADNISKLDVLQSFKFAGQSDKETADSLIKTLSNYAKKPTRGGLGDAHVRPPITDLRQLTTNDVKAALGVSSASAHEVKVAIMKAMLQVPLEVRGLGDRVMDINYRVNPIAAPFARIQGALRFAWNPIFQAKLAYKTEILSQAEANGKIPTIAGTNTVLSTIFPEYYDRLDSIRQTLRDNGIFEKSSGHFGVGGEAVRDGSAVGPNLTHKLIPSQERSIASLVAMQADKAGMSVHDFINTFPSETRDTVQMIAQYDRRASFLNSPLARTLNYAFFPFRFELKVATIMAKSLGRTDPMTQYAVIKGLYNGSNFLKSPEGMAWYSQNSDVIGLLKYFTPLSTLSTVAEVLGTHGTSIGAYGELGGLPFGWIPQLLDAEGLTNFGAGYVDAKTGNSIPSYVPATDRGKLASAIQDLIGSLYTYPGATVGLPSKTTLDRNIAVGITGSSKSKDYTKVQQPLNAQQQEYQQTIQQMSGSTPQEYNATNRPPQTAPSLHVPAQDSSLEHPLPRKVGGTGTGSGKKKKAQYTPALLPGQTQLGQLPWHP